jgi:CBS domain-containing protein
MTNANRFISAYNRIDKTLRSVYGMSAAISFTDLIRRCASKNYVVGANEAVLVDYARLRNAIIHNSTPEMVIAEPHAGVVERFEKIAESVCRPPRAADIFTNRDVTILQAGAKLRDAVRLMIDSHFSNIPVYDGVTLRGILNNKIIVGAIGRAMLEEKDTDNFLRETTVGAILGQYENLFDRYYALCGEKATLEEVLRRFSENGKLIAVLITKRGTRSERPIAIITAYDIVEIHAILDAY